MQAQQARFAHFLAFEYIGVDVKLQNYSLMENDTRVTLSDLTGTFEDEAESGRTRMCVNILDKFLHHVLRT
jgi:hypothetical protein